MKRWLEDRSFRSILRNTSYQAVSKGAAAVAGLATLVFTGRGLGPTLFGVLVLIQSYVQAASGLSKFQSWQVIIRFGSSALAQGDPHPFKRAICFALGLDLVSGIFGMIIAMGVLPLIASSLQIPPAFRVYAIAYCLLLPTMAAATPVGVLRALDRFDLLGWQSTVTPILRGLLVTAAWLLAAPFLWYAAIWFATALIGDLYGWYVAWRELRRRELHAGIRPTLRSHRIDGAWKFAISVNLATSLNAALGPLGNLLVGSILGPAQAGLYRIAKSLAQSVEKPADFLEKAFYPEVLRLDFLTRRPWKLMLRSSAVAAAIGGAICLVLLAGGAYLIPMMLGEQFRGAYPVVAVMVIGSLIVTIAFPVVPMLYALHRATVPVWGKVVGATSFVVTLYPLCRAIGVIGAGAAYVVGDVAALGVMLAVLAREYAGRDLRPDRA